MRKPPRGVNHRLCPARGARQIPMVPSSHPPPDPPPRPAGLAAEQARAGLWLFRWRSYPPVVLLAGVLLAVALDPAAAGGPWARPLWIAGGMAAGALGLLIRGWAVGTIPMGTSGRGTARPRAEALNTQGVYSLLRHPLYLGNALLWVGATLVSGKPAAVLVVALAFWIVYERIMLVEERFLHAEFGAAFEAWAARTPALLPRPAGWVPSPHPFSVRYALGRDYPALYAFVLCTTAVELTRSVAAGGGWRLDPGWLAWLVAGTAVYVVLHALKRLTRALEVHDR